jgi:RNA polymerase sigma-70 factor, ECF subfamily
MPFVTARFRRYGSETLTRLENRLLALNSSKPNSLSLKETVRSASDESSAAFELIYQQHRRQVYALCTRMLRDPIEAEDLAQETFLLVFRKMHTFRGEAAFSSWLYRLTINTVLMSFRRKTHVLASLDELMADWESGGLPEIAKPDMRLSGLFDRLSLEAAVDLLPSGCKAAFILHDVEGYEHREVATILGCSIGNSKSQLHRARRRLRKLLHYVANDETRQRREARCYSSRPIS